MKIDVIWITKILLSVFETAISIMAMAALSIHRYHLPWSFVHRMGKMTWRNANGEEGIFSASPLLCRLCRIRHLVNIFFVSKL